MITVLVGASKTLFHAHKSVPLETSDFFRAALSGPWEESKGGRRASGGETENV